MDDDFAEGGDEHAARDGAAAALRAFAHLDQDALNAAVREGYDHDGRAGSGGGAYFALPPLLRGAGGGAAAAAAHGDGGSGPPPPPGGGHPGGAPTPAWDDDGRRDRPVALGPLSPGPADGGGGGGAGAGDAHPPPPPGTSRGAGGAYPFGGGSGPSSTNLQPVGIIDLECYTAVNRSSRNATVVELAGDRVTNPDLRSFYFQSPSVEEAEAWTAALLGDRHSSLRDETDAYRQVSRSLRCGTFFVFEKFKKSVESWRHSVCSLRRFSQPTPFHRAQHFGL